MNHINYENMTDTELKQYFLKHRNNKFALQAYLDRLNQNPREVIANPNDHNFDEKIQTAILKKLQNKKWNNITTKCSNKKAEIIRTEWGLTISGTRITLYEKEAGLSMNTSDHILWRFAQSNIFKCLNRILEINFKWSHYQILPSSNYSGEGL